MFNGYETEELVAAHVKALLRELGDCERAGNGARAELVRAQLRAFGHEVAAKPAERAEKRPRGKPKKTEERKAG